MRNCVFGAALALLSACSSENSAIYTVDQLVTDQALLVKIIEQCRNNPGELRETPNCRNAEAADGRLRLERMRKSLGG